MELFIIARFHARAGEEATLEATLREVAGPTRAEPDCLAYHAFRATDDPRLFFVHSRWRDQAAFEAHARLPHTVHFLRRVDEVTDEPRDVRRLHLIV